MPTVAAIYGAAWSAFLRSAIYTLPAIVVALVLVSAAELPGGALLLLSVAVWSFVAAVTFRALTGARMAGVPDGASILHQFSTNSLLVFFFAIFGFIVILTLVIFSVILTVASGFDPSGERSDDVSASIDALRASGAIWLLYGLIAAGGAGALWLFMRLCLCGAATFSHGRIMVFRTWGWTKGKVFSLCRAGVAVLLPVGLFAAAVIPVWPHQELPGGWAIACLPFAYVFLAFTMLSEPALREDIPPQ